MAAMFTDSSKIVHCGMPATERTSWFSAPLKYKSGHNFRIGMADKTDSIKIAL